MPYSQALIFGSVAIDEVMSFPKTFAEFIDKDNLENLDISFVVPTLSQSFGGVGANISYNTSQLTKKPVYLLGAIGPDGQRIKKHLEKAGVDLKHLIEASNLYTSTWKAVFDSNQRMISTFYYGAAEKAKEINLEEISNHKESLLLIGSNHKDGYLKKVQEAIDLQVDFIFDPGMTLTWIDDTDLEKGSLNAKYLIANDYEMSQILKRLNKTISDFTSAGVKVITTMGEKGLVYEDKNQKIQLPAHPIPKFIDGTGAGDAFRGGFISSLLEDENLLKALIQGSVAGSFAVESVGGMNHNFDKNEFEKRRNYFENLL